MRLAARVRCFAATGIAALVLGGLGAGAALASASLSANPNAPTVPPFQTQTTITISWNTGNGNPGSVLEDHLPNDDQITTVSGLAISAQAKATVYCNEPNNFQLVDSTTHATLATITVVVNGCGQISLNGVCAVLSNCGTPSHAPNPAPGSSAAPLQVQPSGYVTSWHSYTDEPYFGTSFLGFPYPCLVDKQPDADIDVFKLKNRVGVGYDHHYDPGSQPFPCTDTNDYFYRGGVRFEMSQAHDYMETHGVKSAALDFSPTLGPIDCLGRVGFDNTDWDKWSSIPAVLPSSNINLPAPVHKGTLIDGTEVYSVDLTSFFNATVQVPGKAPHPQWESFWTSPIHFVLIGTDEGNPDNNDACTAEFGNFDLVIHADH
jgi:hypothetical protein